MTLAQISSLAVRVLAGRINRFLKNFSSLWKGAGSIQKNPIMSGVCKFIIILRLFSLSGKLTMFIYPFSSTGAGAYKAPFRLIGYI
jgi:hypothetical protein